ncbi:MAG TPA: D-alanine--D-alanine ligase [Candidatus Limnocylindrales bacterium]|nr:D-alanine--D-alanine ligase [Candidatus Limnocylindrales bacterium]
MNRPARVRVGVLAGGASSEREISLATGIEIAGHLPADRYEVVLVDPLALMARNPQLTDEQREHARALADRSGVIEELPERDRRELPAALQRQIVEGSAGLVGATSALVPTGGQRPFDVVFVAIHGQWGEDGTIQGMLELLGIPYVGSGVLASALAMDKVMAKTVLAAHGLDVPRGFVIDATDGAERVAAAARDLGYPLVAKPVRQGSSVGIVMVEHAEELASAVAEALRYDDRVMIEERLHGTELTVGVIGNKPNLRPLPVIEIVTRNAFFDYRAKYDPELTDEICPARIPEELAERAQQVAVAAHTTLECRDLSRTDMIATADGRLVVLEVNTIPGMTANSLLPKAARVAGLPFGELCATLIEEALARAR